ncbi:hypothetical protein Ancab_001783 [Ancistrocladus abbreviatus]
MDCQSTGLGGTIGRLSLLVAGGFSCCGAVWFLSGLPFSVWPLELRFLLFLSGLVRFLVRCFCAGICSFFCLVETGFSRCRCRRTGSLWVLATGACSGQGDFQ